MKKVLFIGLVWPEPTSSAAGWRMLQLLQLFRSRYEVHFASAAAKSPYSHDLHGMGVCEHAIQLNDPSFDEFVRTLNPEIVVFDRFMIEEQYGWRVARACPRALRVLDTEDLHFLRGARLEAFRRQAPPDLYTDTTMREIAAIYRSDLSLIISESEVQLLTDTFGVDDALLQYVPFIEEQLSPAHLAGLPTFEQRRDFVFIGNFVHEPNWRTVEVLKRTIWPELRCAVRDAALHIYGAYVPPKALQLHKPSENFHILGRAVDARETLSRYRVLLAPIPAGAGTKGKFVDAMYSGTPSMSSTVGAEAMSEAGRWSGFVTDDTVDFVRKSMLLYTDRSTWEEAQQVGFELFNSRFADPSRGRKLLETCDELLHKLAAHRRANFVGQLLQHHSMQSTKYMARWIEAKNRR